MWEGVRVFCMALSLTFNQNNFSRNNTKQKFWSVKIIEKETESNG